MVLYACMIDIVGNTSSMCAALNVLHVYSLQLDLTFISSLHLYIFLSVSHSIFSLICYSTENYQSQIKIASTLIVLPFPFIPFCSVLLHLFQSWLFWLFFHKQKQPLNSTQLNLCSVADLICKSDMNLTIIEADHLCYHTIIILL